MKPGDLRLFEVDSDRLGDDLFSGRLVFLLKHSDEQLDSSNPSWDVLLGGKTYRMSEGMLDRWSTPV